MYASLSAEKWDWHGKYAHILIVVIQVGDLLHGKANTKYYDIE